MDSKEKMVDLEVELERLESGELMLDEAFVLVGGAKDGAAEPMAHQWYRALRGWTGRALGNAYSAEELRGWHELIETVAAAVQFEGDWSVRLDVLKELVFERIGMIENRSPSEIVQRRHVVPLLRALAEAATGTLARRSLMTLLDLQQANLTRVCNLLVDAAMVRRHSEGPSASFEITLVGMRALADAAALSANREIAEMVAASEVRPDVAASPWNGVVVLADHRGKRVRSDVSEWAKHDEPLPMLDAA